MKEPGSSVVFDYTSFLGISSQQKWTFADALHYFSSSEEADVNKENSTDSCELEGRLWKKAINVLSSRKSDESNLLALIDIARAEGIEELKLLMPYDLDPEQLLAIKKHTKELVDDRDHDELFITL